MSDIVEKHGADASTEQTQVAASTVEVPSYQPRQTFGQMLRNDLGFLPVLFTLILIVAFFQILNPIFLQGENFTNILLQSASLGIYSSGTVLVLLLGEIDLSVAAVGTLCAVVMAILTERHGWSAGPAIIIALLIGAAAGLLNGIFVAILRIPSFIVTLAFFIIYSGLLLFLLGSQTTQSVGDPFVLSLAGTPVSYFTDVLGVGLPTLAVLAYVASLIYDYFTRKKAGLRTMSMTRLIIQSVIAIAIVEVVVALLENYQGVPYSMGILFGLILLLWLVLTKTSFGRHVYAVGGNAEASRRAGINVVGIRIAVFVLCSAIAAVAAIVDTSRQNAVASAIPSMLQLDIIAAAVIGGVSLFGGRGSIWAVVLGMFIVQCLDNGLSLLNQTTDVQQMIEGLVLILAVTSDALIRRAQTRSRSGK
ncbi:sugar ABC transporter permease [Dictyobacter aurantiacus]|uniref:Xylose transport system permease protein XylH n=1 Tax=Dictyobacter aurantiacus TaxID=1936993 RepID=A0A401Z7B5_9CHLR|nr:inner-membrane translocator [Dictyobacter aurantiacus]GCE02708.1 ABC transporter permease [Dictyobacter aurantiacus]